LVPIQTLLDRLLNTPDDGSQKVFTYDEAKTLARHPDPEIRRSLALRRDVVPEILYFLASDPDPVVRRHLACNTSTPRQADYMLSNDADQDVRSGLAKKIARLAPGLSEEEQDKIQHVTYLTLEKLAYDQMPMVRHAISETIKSMPNVPHSIVQKLARDLDIIVSAPVLEFSPILTDADLLEIINANPVAGALSAIAKRDGLSADVSNSIAHSDDIEAMSRLLENGSAQLQEDALDALIETSRTRTVLQEPLVHRPNLPRAAAQRLASFVAEHLMLALAKRNDLPDETFFAVKTAVKERLKDFPPNYVSDARRNLFELEAEVSRARRFSECGELTEDMILDAVYTDGSEAFAKAALSVRSGLPPQVVLNILNASSPKAIVALAWKAGVSMEIAIHAQSRLGHIKPGNIIHAVDGTYPLSVGEMETQLALFEAEAKTQQGIMPFKST